VSGWPVTSLRELMTLRPPDIEVAPNNLYHFAGVYCFVRGLFAGQKKQGLEFAYKRLTRLRSGDFVYPKLMAWEGALAVVPPECDGLYVSPEFPVFEIDTKQAEPKYLDYYFRRRSVWPKLSGESTGTNVRRRRLHPSSFLRYEIELPPLAEQQRIVKRIDALVANLDAAWVARKDVENCNQHLLNSAFHRIILGAPTQLLGEIAPLTRRPATIDPFQDYPQVSVRSFGRGTFHNPPLKGSEITWEKPHLVKAGDVLISNIKAWEGAIAVAQPEDDGRYGSHRYLTYTPVPRVATSRFICFFLLTAEGLHYVGKASPGSADRNRTTNAKALLEIPVPVPSLERQLWFGQLFDKVSAISHLHAQATASSEAMVPAILNRAFSGDH
jgi:type I restriction enzyme S subunit